MTGPAQNVSRFSSAFHPQIGKGTLIKRFQFADWKRNTLIKQITARNECDCARWQFWIPRRVNKRFFVREAPVDDREERGGDSEERGGVSECRARQSHFEAFCHFPNDVVLYLNGFARVFSRTFAHIRLTFASHRTAERV